MPMAEPQQNSQQSQIQTYVKQSRQSEQISVVPLLIDGFVFSVTISPLNHWYSAEQVIRMFQFANVSEFYAWAYNFMAWIHENLMCAGGWWKAVETGTAQEKYLSFAAQSTENDNLDFYFGQDQKRALAGLLKHKTDVNQMIRWIQQKCKKLMNWIEQVVHTSYKFINSENKDLLKWQECVINWHGDSINVYVGLFN